MASGFEDFRRKVVDCLQTDLELAASITAVHDQPPRTAKLPYLTLGPMSAEDWSTKSFQGFRIRLMVNVFSDQRGDAQMLAIADKVTARLMSEGLSLDGFHVATIRFDGFSNLIEPGGIRRGIVRFGILMHAL